jgi:hypothetical protein
MKLARTLVLCSLLSGSLMVQSVVGCGPSKPAADAIVSKPMPNGEVWAGVYYHPVFGHLHLEEKDGAVMGRWRDSDKGKWGELIGTSQGNVVRYTWKSHRYGIIGPAATTEGKGYFVYVIGESRFPEIRGKYGVGDLPLEGDWNCVKQVGKVPDLQSITGNPGTGEIPLIEGQ